MPSWELICYPAIEARCSSLQAVRQRFGKRTSGSPVFGSATGYPRRRSSSMMRCARTGKWTCTSASLWSESSNLTQQRPITVLATETQVIVSLPADRVTNQGKRSRTRKPSVLTSKRPSGHPAIFLPICASTANDRHAGAAGGFSAPASRKAWPNGPCGLLEPALPAIEPRVGGRARPASSGSARNAGEGPGTW